MATVTIERLGHHGDGIASGPVYAARTLPGETVEGTLDGNRLQSPKILTPSAERISPKCGHYKSCGGCSLQHASDTFVSDWQKEVVSRSLEAVGLQAPIRNVHRPPPSSRRRATFTGRRTKKGAIVGFHAPASDALLSVPDCQILRPSLLAALPALEDITRAGVSRKGSVRLSVTETDTGLDVAMSEGKPLDPQLNSDLINISNKAAFARISWDGDVIAQRVPPILRLGTAPVPIPLADFYRQRPRENPPCLRPCGKSLEMQTKRSTYSRVAGHSPYRFPRQRKSTPLKASRSCLTLFTPDGDTPLASSA